MLDAIVAQDPAIGAARAGDGADRADGGASGVRSLALPATAAQYTQQLAQVWSHLLHSRTRVVRNLCRRSSSFARSSGWAFRIETRKWCSWRYPTHTFSEANSNALLGFMTPADSAVSEVNIS